MPNSSKRPAAAKESPQRDSLYSASRPPTPFPTTVTTLDGPVVVPGETAPMFEDLGTWRIVPPAEAKPEDEQIPHSSNFLRLVRAPKRYAQYLDFGCAGDGSGQSQSSDSGYAGDVSGRSSDSGETVVSISRAPTVILPQPCARVTHAPVLLGESSSGDQGGQSQDSHPTLHSPVPLVVDENGSGVQGAQSMDSDLTGLESPESPDPESPQQSGGFSPTVSEQDKENRCPTPPPESAIKFRPPHRRVKRIPLEPLIIPDAPLQDPRTQKPAVNCDAPVSLQPHANSQQVLSSLQYLVSLQPPLRLPRLPPSQPMDEAPLPPRHAYQGVWMDCQPSTSAAPDPDALPGKPGMHDPSTSEETLLLALRESELSGFSNALRSTNAAGDLLWNELIIDGYDAAPDYIFFAELDRRCRRGNFAGRAVYWPLREYLRKEARRSLFYPMIELCIFIAAAEGVEFDYFSRQARMFCIGAYAEAAARELGLNLTDVDFHHFNDLAQRLYGQVS